MAQKQVSATVSALRSAELHNMTLYLGHDGSTYWLPQPMFTSDRPLATVEEFLGSAGYSSMDGMDDDKVITVGFEVADEAPAPVEAAEGNQ